MAKRLQHRGGTTSQHSTFTGAVREVTVDTDKNTLVVHDGATAGGHPLATATNFTSTGIDDNATSTAITITSGNDVCIGSTNSGLGGAIDLSIGNTSSAGGITLWSPTTGAHSIGFGDGYTGTDRYRGYLEYRHNDDSMRFGTSATERMRINSSGNVGIGTSSPTQKLDVNGQINVSGGITFSGALGSGTGIASSGTNGNLRLYSGGVQVVTVTSSNVGIGTNSPVSKLHIKDGEPTVENTTSLGSETVNFVYSQAGGASGLTVTLATLSSPTTAAFAHAKIDWGSIYSVTSDNGGAKSEVLWLKYKTDGTYVTKEATLGSVGDNIGSNFYWDDNVLKVDIPVYNSINANITITYTKFGSITVNV